MLPAALLAPSAPPLVDVEYARLKPCVLTVRSSADVLLVLCTQHLAKVDDAEPQDALMTRETA